eukprot:7184222-Prymnesium_polylepis.1
MDLLGPSVEHLWWSSSAGTALSPTCVLLLGVQVRCKRAVLNALWRVARGGGVKVRDAVWRAGVE